MVTKSFSLQTESQQWGVPVHVCVEHYPVVSYILTVQLFLDIQNVCIRIEHTYQIGYSLF